MSENEPKMVTISKAELDELYSELEEYKLSLEDMSRRAYRAEAQVKGWRSIMVAEPVGFKIVQGGPFGDGDDYKVAIPSPKQITQLLDELADLRERQGSTPDSDNLWEQRAKAYLHVVKAVAEAKDFQSQYWVWGMAQRALTKYPPPMESNDE